MEFINGWNFLFGDSETKKNATDFQNFLETMYGCILKGPLLTESLEGIENKFDELKNDDLFRDVVPIFYNIVRNLLNHKDYKEKTIVDIAKFIEKLMSRYSTNEDIELILKLIYQILIIFTENNVRDLGSNINIFEKVTDYTFSNYKPVSVFSLWCLNLIFENYKRKDILDEIWEKIKKEKHPIVNKLRVLNHFHEHFFAEGRIFKEVEYWEMLYNALEFNAEPVIRKHAICILKRTIEALRAKNGKIVLKVEQYIDWNQHNQNECYKSWMIFFAIFENLEEKQSHLILPALEMFVQAKDIFKFKDLLISQMLNHKNVLVVKWSIDHILKSMKITDFQNDDLLYDLLASLNKTFLYTIENNFDFFLLDQFIEPDITRFIKIFAKLNNWKAVPMHVCLQCLLHCKVVNENYNFSCDDHVLLEIAAKIRQLLNRNIRESCKFFYFQIFEKELDNLKILLQVVAAIETKNDGNCSELLNNTIDRFKGNYEDVSLNINALEISASNEFVSNVKDDIMKLFMRSNPTAEELLKAMSFKNLKLSTDPTFIALVLEKLSIPDLPSNSTIKDIICRMKASTDPEISFYMKYILLQRGLVSMPSQDLYEYHIFETIKNFKTPGSYSNELKQIFVDSYVQFMRQMYKYDWIVENMMSLIDVGGQNTLENIIWALYTKRNYIVSAVQFNRILFELKSYIKNYGCSKIENRIHLLVGYIVKNMGDQRYTLLNQILNIDPENFDIHNIMYGTSLHKFHLNDEERDFLIRGLTFGVALHGDEKTEWEYEKRTVGHQGRWPSDVRYKCFEILNAIIACNLQLKDIFLTNLTNKILEMSLALNAKKPRYFDNSKQHRLKLRLTQALAFLHAAKPEWRDEYLVTILEENNQTNVSVIMEIIIASSITWGVLEEMLKHIADVTPSRQVSVMHITFLYLFDHYSPAVNNKVLEYILPLTMGQNFSTRFYAQLFLSKSPDLFSVDEISDQLFHCIERSLIPLQEKVRQEARFALSKPMSLLSKKHILHTIPNKTNMATDELFGQVYSIERLSIELTTSGNCNVAPNIETYDNVQRKMNPVQFDENFSRDIFYSKLQKKRKNNSDIIVVASLINKLPNLGGIARTCEVFGVDKLALRSLRFAESTEFKTLSMTAEKWLNIIEVKCDDLGDFLCKKKLDGYHIVGAEQTKESVCFTQFEFPKKTVLLLGHEKEGIPGNLISLLDHAVEIPQFGMVRSLNVHVTAALFMWEYRKQMLTK